MEEREVGINQFEFKGFFYSNGLPSVRRDL